MGMTDKFVQKMVDKYGLIVVNLKTATLDQLESLAKDIQRETNRRYDIAFSRKEMRETEAFKKLEKSGGKISLSHNVERVNGNLKLVKNQTTNQYRYYLMNEIERGFEFLKLKKSTYTGFKDWKKNVIEGAQRAYTGAGGTDTEFLKMFNDVELSKYFWKCVRAFEEKYTSVYYSKGSAEVIRYTHEIIRDKTGLTVDDVVRIIYEGFLRSLTPAEILDDLEQRRKT